MAKERGWEVESGGSEELTTAEEMIVILAGVANDNVVLGGAFDDAEIGPGD